MELKEIVNKLVGKISPLGCASRDPQRLENLKAMCGLITDLIQEVQYVSRNKDRYEGSVKAIGEYADKFLREDVRELLKDRLDLNIESEVVFNEVISIFESKDLDKIRNLLNKS